MLLLCSCATQRQAEKFFDKNTDKLADYVDRNMGYTRDYGSLYAVRHFPPRYYPPAIRPSVQLVPGRLSMMPLLERIPDASQYPAYTKCPECQPAIVTQTVYLEDTVRLDAIRMELNKERQAHGAVKEQLKQTEAERDYWQEMNRKKFWTLILMAIFAALYILFKVLAARVRETEV